MRISTDNASKNLHHKECIIVSKIRQVIKALHKVEPHRDDMRLIFLYVRRSVQFKDMEKLWKVGKMYIGTYLTSAKNPLKVITT